MYLLDCCHVNDFRTPKPFVPVAAACGATASSKKTLPWILGLCLPLEVACLLPQALPLVTLVDTGPTFTHGVMDQSRIPNHISAALSHEPQHAVASDVPQHVPFHAQLQSEP